MKFSLFLLVLATTVSSFSGCSTLANRRDLYKPVEASGPYTTKYRARYHQGVFGVSQNVHHPRLENEGIFGISNSDARYYTRETEEGGIFGISRNVR